MSSITIGEVTFIHSYFYHVPNPFPNHPQNTQHNAKSGVDSGEQAIYDFESPIPNSTMDSIKIE